MDELVLTLNIPDHSQDTLSQLPEEIQQVLSDFVAGAFHVNLMEICICINTSVYFALVHRFYDHN